MIPGLMLAVALTTDPAVVSAWPASDADAHLAVEEVQLRDQIAEHRKGVEHFQTQFETYAKNLAAGGTPTEQQLKMASGLARRRDDCSRALSDAQERMTEVQRLRERERKLRADPPKEGKR